MALSIQILKKISQLFHIFTMLIVKNHIVFYICNSSKKEKGYI